MKKSELFFSAIQVPVDYAMIVLAAITAFSMRDIPEIIALRPLLYDFPFRTYINIVLVVAPLFLVVMAFYGLYQIRVTRKFGREALNVFAAISVGLMILIVAIFLKRQWFSSRFIILTGWMFAAFYVVAARYVIQKIQKWLLVVRGIGVHRVLLIGSNGKMSRVRKMIDNNPYLGYHVVGHIDEASVRSIKDVRSQEGVDEIIMCDPTVTDMEQEKIIDFCAINNIAYEYIPTTFQTARFNLKMFAGEPIIEILHTPLDGWGRIAKRIFDIVGSIMLIVLFSPIMLAVALAVKWESIFVEKDNGPIIFKNERIGADGRKFFVYKFRYLKWKYCITEENPQTSQALEYENELIKELSVRQGPLYKIKNDPRKTRVGNFIERTTLDELPQFLNVLKGEMSLVGPRPHQEREVAKYHEYHRRLLTIKPGVTGMAQVSGRSDLAFENEYKLDVYYIENWSLWLDLVLCLKTVGVMLRRRRNN